MDDSEKWYGWFWGYNERIHAAQLACVSVQGHASTLLPVVMHANNTDL
jgi:hypothetical protein